MLNCCNNYYMFGIMSIHVAFESIDQVIFYQAVQHCARHDQKTNYSIMYIWY